MVRDTFHYIKLLQRGQKDLQGHPQLHWQPVPVPHHLHREEILFPYVATETRHNLPPNMNSSASENTKNSAVSTDTAYAKLLFYHFLWIAVPYFTCHELQLFLCFIKHCAGSQSYWKNKYPSWWHFHIGKTAGNHMQHMHMKTLRGVYCCRNNWKTNLQYTAEAAMVKLQSEKHQTTTICKASD